MFRMRCPASSSNTREDAGSGALPASVTSGAGPFALAAGLVSTASGLLSPVDGRADGAVLTATRERRWRRCFACDTRACGAGVGDAATFGCGAGGVLALKGQRKYAHPLRKIVKVRIPATSV